MRGLLRAFSRTGLYFLVAGLTAALYAAEPGEKDNSHGRAALTKLEHLSNSLEVPATCQGFCLDLSYGNGQLTAELLQKTKFFVFALTGNDAECTQARQAIEQGGFLGKRATAMVRSGKTLPFPRCYLNLIVAGHYQDSIDFKEVLRVLSPNGLAVIGGDPADAGKLKADVEKAGIKGCVYSGNYAIFKGQMPEGLDEWTHVTPRPDNIMNTRDPNMRPPFRTQWVLNSPLQPGRCAAIAGGRVVYRNQENLCAWDSFNGALLWERALTAKSNCRYALVDGSFYTEEGESIIALDAASGERKASYRLDGYSEPASWKYQTTGWSEGRYQDKLMLVDVTGVYWWWLAVENGKLFGLAQTPTTKTNNINGTGDLLCAFDLKSGGLLWKMQPKAPVYGPSVALSGGKLFFFTLSRPQGDGIPKRQQEGGLSSVHALDADTGKELWTGDLPRVEWPRIQYQPAAGVWDGRYFVWCTMDNQGARGTKAFDTQTGKLVKEYPQVHSMGIGNAMPVLFVDKKMYFNNGGLTGGAFWANKYRCADLATGAVEQPPFDQFSKSGCGPGNATPTCIFNGGQGMNAFDLETGKAWSHLFFRSPCYMGPIVGNGIVLHLPVACQCAYPQKAPMAIVPAGIDWVPPDPAHDLESRLVEGAAFTTPLLDDADDEWTHYRGNPGHTGETSTAPKTPLAAAWERKLGGQLTAPSFGAGLVFVASQEGAVWGLDQQSGQIRWKYLCGGAVLVTPAYAKGRVLVGSADGWVYCLEAHSGQLAWRFRAAPEEYFINHGGDATGLSWKQTPQGLLASTWPASAGVLVEDTQVFCAAGWFPWDGNYLYALELASGRPVWSKQIGFPNNMEGAPRGMLTAGQESLIVPLATRPPQAYRKSDGERLPWCVEPKGIFKGFVGHQKPVGAGVVALGDIFFIGDADYCLVDGSSGWHYGKTTGPGDFQNRRFSNVTPSGIAPVLGKRVIVGDAAVYDRAKFCEALKTDPKKAKQQVLCSMQLWLEKENTSGLALAGDVLLASGKMEVAAFEANPAGKELGRVKIGGQILRNSLAVSNGQVFVVTEGGSLYCLRNK